MICIVKIIQMVYQFWMQTKQYGFDNNANRNQRKDTFIITNKIQ